MYYSYPLLVVTIVALSMLGDGPRKTHACGFPPPPPMMPMCCCPGGRRKRAAAVQPHIKNNDVPCPQVAWKAVIQQNIVENDAQSSVDAIQTALTRRYESKFLVVCASNNSNDKENLPNNVHLSSGGDGYCNVLNQRIWCQVAALSA